MIFRVSAIARARCVALANHSQRRYASTPATTTGGNTSALNSFASAWYQMYV